MHKAANAVMSIRLEALSSLRGSHLQLSTDAQMRKAVLAHPRRLPLKGNLHHQQPLRYGLFVSQMNHTHVHSKSEIRTDQLQP